MSCATRSIAPWSWLPFAADGVPTQMREISLPKHRLPHVARHRHVAVADHLRHQVDHAFFDDRRLAFADQRQLGRVHIDADNLVAVSRETGQRHGAHVAQPKDAYSQFDPAC
jgi:hypothetical protein